MPSLTITAAQEHFDQTVDAICFNGNWSEELGISKFDFAVDRLKKWMGEQLVAYGNAQIEALVREMQASSAEKVAMVGSVVEIKVSE